MKRVRLIFAAIGLAAALAACGGGAIPAKKLTEKLGKLTANTADTPHTVKLDNTVNINAKGSDVDEAIEAEGKYVILDLSECRATGNTIGRSFGGDDYTMGNEFITGIILPKSLTAIGENAFYRCSGLSSVTIPAGVTSIGGSAFSGCSSLSSVTIPASVTSIGGGAFSGCDSLNSVTFASGSAITEDNFRDWGGLRDAYLAGGAGTYTREPEGETWTKQ
jgi:hypothetical protein